MPTDIPPVLRTKELGNQATTRDGPGVAGQDSSSGGTTQGTQGLRLGNGREEPPRPNRGRMEYLVGTMSTLPKARVIIQPDQFVDLAGLNPAWGSLRGGWEAFLVAERQK